MFAGIYRYYVNRNNRRRWKKEAKSILPLIGCPETAKEFQADGKILVVAPHADDELIGCHQMITNHREQTTIFYCSYLGSNSSENNKKTREREFVDYVQAMSVDHIISSPNTIEADLRAALNEIKPRYVFLPSFVDWHSEHRLVNIVLSSVIVQYKPPLYLCWYHITIPIPRKYVYSFSRMNREQHRYKWKQMSRCYKSQLHMDLQRYRYVEQLSGLEIDYAETYIKMSVAEWNNILKILSNEINNLDNLKKSLGKINQMYQLSEQLYKKVFSI